MKRFNQISKILLIEMAIVGLAIGMSTVAGYNNAPENVNLIFSTDNSLLDSNCGSGKCGGDKGVAKNSNFIDIDTNEDGKVSKTEFTDYGTKEFPNKDANKDGKITIDECVMFDSFNTDGNDYLSKTEFQTGHNSMFLKMDKNSDGFIDVNESYSMHKSESAKCGGDTAKSRSY